MREMIVGLTESLHLRAVQKSALRQSNTTIQPRDNNALKFSAGVDETLSNLFFRESEQYLTAVESVRDAFGDIRVHQQILMKAMQSALAGYIGRLDPEELEEKFSNGRHGVLMGAANKFKYWDLYKDLYQIVAQQNPGELPQLFLEEMARAYELESSRTAPHRGQNLKAGAA
jgi:type VI secretion system FHA domain protein